MVFDVRRKENAHLFVSDIRSGKHTDPVWEVSACRTILLLASFESCPGALATIGCVQRTEFLLNIP